MKRSKMVELTALISALVLGARALQAQETNQIEQLRRQLLQMQADFERVQREQKEQIDALTRKLDTLGSQQTAAAEKEKIEQQVAAELQKDQPPSKQTTTSAATKSASNWSPTAPIRVGKGGTYMDIGMVATFAVGGSTASDIEGGTQLGGHDPNQRGFTVQGAEVNFTGAVDPYFRGNANVVFQIDSGGESFIELEEAWLETISLPANLQVRGGQFLTDFGRLNTQHPHAWAFVDTPLVNGRLLGPDGLRNPGARISWLAPTPFYSELLFAVQNSQGETAFSYRDDHGGQFFDRLHDQGRVKSFSDVLFTPRYTASFDLTDTQTLLAGVSSAFGPNGSGSATDTQIYGVDLYWKWKPANAHAGFPFVSFQTEAMLRRYQAGTFDWDWVGATAGAVDPGENDLNGDGVPDVLPRETLTDYGLYAQVAYGFSKGWVAALRGDWVSSKVAEYEHLFGRDPARATRWRVSPNLTWYPSEFSKIRLQYNYDDRSGVGVDHSVWLQFEFLLGAHAAHKF